MNNEIKREQFLNTMDWVKYQITGQIPDYLQEEENPLLHKFKVKGGKYPLKFYNDATIKGRKSVNYSHNKAQYHICSCDEPEILDVQNYFDTHFNGENIEEVREALKEKYNRRRRCLTLQNANITFTAKHGTRIHASTAYGGNRYGLCSCDVKQKEEVTELFHKLKNEKPIEEIQLILKSKYNKEHPKPKVKKQSKAKSKKDDENNTTIILHMDGTCYHDGKYNKIDAHYYEFIKNIIYSSTKR